MDFSFIYILLVSNIELIAKVVVFQNVIDRAAKASSTDG